MHELTKVYEIDGRFHVIKSVGFDLDNMTAKEIADNSFADFKTEKEAISWSRKRSRDYKPEKDNIKEQYGDWLKSKN